MSQLVTKSDVESSTVCENCGKVGNSAPLGWLQCGLSRRRVRDDVSHPGTGATWCSEACFNSRESNPTLAELRKLREKLRAEKRAA